ncbi:CesT family type III secretion system chaperone [Pseudomonas entomophila]|uniref:CesT family type III secretion system chaperone n=1 Tax=Pseudomonas entomophila TaxID=312306 RepID=UPI001F00E084|nr:CesT family type III secretion system chaperone [Pseudomonas entomophila]MCG8295120.1 CesT family type III secretion system chaperone [Pseudomonas entomophila]
MTQLQALLDTFSEQHGFPPLQLDDEGSCQLLVDDKLPLSLLAHPFRRESVEPALMLRATIGLLAAAGTLRQQSLERLSHANYSAGAETGHTLALAPDGRQLVLFGLRPLASLTPQDLAEWLTLLTRQALEWRAYFALVPKQLPPVNSHPSQHDSIRI